MTVDPLTLSPVGTELLDDPGADPAAVTESLRNIARANRWFGGSAAALHGVSRVLSGISRGTSLTLLDLGTGAGDLPLAAARRAARKGIRLRPLGLERSRVAAALARAAGVPCAVACAGAPPFGPKSVDVVLVSQVLHHLDAGSAVRLLRACDRLARLGVVVSDLRRGSLAPLAFWFGSHALRFDRYTRTDGLTSIRRGYSAGELRELLRTAGVGGRVSRRLGYRLVATWKTGG
jgi:SAM-dependent methyltransferase